MTILRGENPGGSRVTFAVPVALGAVIGALLAGCPDDNPQFDGTVTDGDLDLDVDVDGDGDTDVDSDSDSDSDSDDDVDVDEIRPDSCTNNSECAVGVNFNVCCPCPQAYATALFETEWCIRQVRRGVIPERPDGCGTGCTPDVVALCPACGVEPEAVECVGTVCATQYTGECHPCMNVDSELPCPEGAQGCPAGAYCMLEEDGANCVTRDLCLDDSTCPEGWRCDNWRRVTPPERFCWHPESTCGWPGAGVQPAEFDHTSCVWNSFCSDPDDDGIYRCEPGGDDCRTFSPGTDCPEVGAECDDAAVPPDNDGRGACV